MRIEAPQLNFRGPGSGLPLGDAGRFISAGDPDRENQTAAVGAKKITPQQALRIAAVFDEVLSENIGRPVINFTAGVEAQNAWARVQAASAVKVAELAATKARATADALAAWDSELVVPVDQTDAAGDTPPRSSR